MVPLRCESGDTNPTVDGASVAINYVAGDTNYVKYLIIPIANYTDPFDVVFEGETVRIEPVTECKYDLTEIQFLNRYGALEVIHFYKATVETISTTSESFKNAYYDGGAFVVTKHQDQKLNVGSNIALTIESGFLSESYKETMKELMQTEKAWLGQVPINVESKSLKLKSRLVDKLISYSVDFKYAFDEINTI